MTPPCVIDHVVSLVGTPYRFGSRDVAAGLDCLTLCAEVYRRLGWVFPLPRDYSANYIPAEAFLEWEERWAPCGREDWAIVDMRPAHCGVVLPDRRVMHCRDRAGVVIQRMSVLERWIRGTWRLRGL